MGEGYLVTLKKNTQVKYYLVYFGKASQFSKVHIVILECYQITLSYNFYEMFHQEPSPTAIPYYLHCILQLSRIRRTLSNKAFSHFDEHHPLVCWQIAKASGLHVQ